METSYYGTNDRIYLYKRSGNTLTHKQTLAMDGGTRFAAWSGSYLIVGAHYHTYTAFGSGDKSIGVFLRSGDTLTLGNEYGSDGSIEGLAINPDGDHIAVSLYRFGDTSYWIQVWSWDGAGNLTFVDDVESTYGFLHEVDWDSTGGYVAAAMEDDYLGWGFNVSTWNGSSLTDITPTDDLLVSGYNEGRGLRWHHSQPYLFVVGDFDLGGGDLAAAVIYQRSGDSFTVEVEGPVESFVLGEQAALHPYGDPLAIPYWYDGDQLILYDTGLLDAPVFESATITVPLICRIGPYGENVIHCPLYASIGVDSIPGDRQITLPLYAQVGE